MKIVIAGNYGANNLGDEMILEGCLQSLRSVAPNAEITVLSGNPTQTARKYDVQSAPHFPSGFRSFIRSLFKPSKTKKLVQQCDYFILGGGGLFGSLTFKANLIWAVQAFKARRYKKPVLHYGQSIGELKGRIRKWLVRKTFQNSSLIVVRDQQSKKRLKSIGVTKKIYVIPDLAFRSKAQTTPRQDTVLVALRQTKSITPQFKQTIKDFLDWLKTDKEVKFIEFQKEPHPQADKPLHKEILQDAEHTNDFIPAKLVLGMRLHSIIAAIKTNTPFIAISYAPKVEAFLQYAKLEDYMLQPEELTSEKLKSLFNKVQNSHHAITQRLEAFNKKALQRFAEFERLTLRNFLSSDSKTHRK